MLECICSIESGGYTDTGQREQLVSVRVVKNNVKKKVQPPTSNSRYDSESLWLARVDSLCILSINGRED